jgi:hypothetical protein
MAFNRCSSLTGVNIPASVNEIGYGAFCGCGSLASINIPAGVTQIDELMFHSCKGLTSISIPESVTYIGDQAFFDCKNLSGVFFYGNAPRTGFDIFANANSELTVFYLKGKTGFTTPTWCGVATAKFDNGNKPAAQLISVMLDGKQLEFNSQPVILNGTTLVEFRTIFENLGLYVSWDKSTRIVTGTKSGLDIKLKAGSNTATVNGVNKTLQASPGIINGYTMVPLRFIAEASGKSVIWDGDSDIINID